MSRRIKLLPLALLSLWLALPAHAGMFDGDALDATAKLRADHEARLERLDGAARNQVELANQIQALKDELAKLQGKVEVLTFELEQAAKRQKDFYVDLDTRLRKLEAAQVEAAAQAQKPKTDPAKEAQDFEVGLNLMKSSSFKEAAETFRDFIKKYPESSYTPGAHYWGGNAHFQLKEWQKAAELYAAMQAKWPQDTKAPDVLLKLADAQTAGGDAKTARKTLENLLAQYPGTPAAATAQQRLKKK